MDTTPEDPFDELLRRARRDERLARLSGRAAGRDATAPSASAAARPTRRHAAKGSRGAALGLSVVSTLGLAAWLHQTAGAATTAMGAGDAIDLASSAAAPPSTTPSTTVTPGSSARSTPSTTVPTTSTTTRSTSTSLADGLYTGTSASTRWGPVQVRITVANGRINAVDVISYPSNDNKSRSISASAVPRLVQSTLTAQSSNVSSVSGATFTSGAYRTSLQSAIDQARRG